MRSAKGKVEEEERSETESESDETKEGKIGCKRGCFGLCDEGAVVQKGCAMGGKGGAGVRTQAEGE